VDYGVSLIQQALLSSEKARQFDSVQLAIHYKPSTIIKSICIYLSDCFFLLNLELYLIIKEMIEPSERLCHFLGSHLLNFLLLKSFLLLLHLSDLVPSFIIILK
jgi:hypothetical protein